MTLEIFGYKGIKTISIIIELANIGLLTGLLHLYTKSYRQIKIGFTVGLILFAILLLIKSILTIIFIITDTDVFIGRPVYIGGIIEIIALTILLKISNI
ncbi:hypothetical protein [Methanobacterium oryzae]|uniref:hypothetical protein n=1 Tax=Methanobacterium oryzae TaxID=69540 RepID=UPI003D2279A1